MTMTATQHHNKMLSDAKAEQAGARRIERMIVGRENDKAVMVKQPGTSFSCWLPKSQLSDVARKNGKLTDGSSVVVISFTLPAWLAAEKCL